MPEHAQATLVLPNLFGGRNSVVNSKILMVLSYQFGQATLGLGIQHKVLHNIK